MPKRAARRDDQPFESLTEAWASVQALRQHLQRLEQSIAAGIATREVVVAGEDGIPRVVISADATRGRVEIFGRSGLGVPSSVEMFGLDAAHGIGAHVGVALVERGDIVAIFEAIDDEPPDLWLGDTSPA